MLGLGRLRRVGCSGSTQWNNPTNLTDPTGFVAGDENGGSLVFADGKKKEKEKEKEEEACDKRCQQLIKIYNQTNCRLFGCHASESGLPKGKDDSGGQGQNTPAAIGGGAACGMGHGSTACHLAGMKQHPEETKLVLEIITPGAGIYGAIGDAKEGKYGMAVLGVLSEIPLAKLGKLGKLGKLAKEAETVGQTVLGHYPEYKVLAESLNARRFNIPESAWNKMSETERWAANQKFLDRMISRGDTVILATPLDKVRPGSYFARELEYLSSKGYSPSADGTRLIPLGGQ